MVRGISRIGLGSVPGLLRRGLEGPPAACHNQAMRTALRSSDERLVRRLLAPPDLADGVESLHYWRERSQRLPWYQFRMRREAVRMTVLWERRVSEALMWQRRASVADRLSAGVLVARARLGRWGGRARRVAIVTATVVIAAVVIPAIALTVALIHWLL
jgi:hypothetical protein